MHKFWGFALLLLASSAAAAAPPAPVVIDHVRREAINRDQAATGTVHSQQIMQVMAGIDGRLDWLAEAGRWVAAGEPLARIDVRPLQLALAEQQAQIARERINLSYLDKEVARIEALGEGQYASVGERDALLLRRDLARADLAIAQVRVRQLEDQIARGSISAPFAGVITVQNHYAGEELNRGAVLSQLVSVERIELRAQLPLSWLSQLKAGDILRLGLPDGGLLGTIRSLIAAGHIDSQSFEARIDLPAQAAQRLAVGQLVSVQLPGEMLAQALLVPRDALVLRREASYVFKIDDAQTAQRIEVQVGSGHGDWISVQGELQEGDAVAVRGAERLQTGQAVQVIRDLAQDQGADAS